ncbi:MAG: hypothetical protein OXB88_00275 [Bacteriovoracales bacterium]|nr:hypothetical protein [Bacteriovoracales bacterium]
MMKFFKSLKTAFIFWILLLTFFFPSAVSWGMDSKAQVLLRAGYYGSVAGALLGVASLAFGSGPRSVAQGASLGLYGGLLFGGHLIFDSRYKGVQYGEGDGGMIYPDGPDAIGDFPTDMDQLRFWQDRIGSDRKFGFGADFFRFTF